MDTKMRSLRLLGTFGIVGEAFKIIHSQPKLMRAITLVMILPCALIILLNTVMAPFLVSKIFFMRYPEGFSLTILEFTEFTVLELVCIVLFYVTLMPSIAAVVHIVAGFYKGEEQNSIAAVMKPVPAVWKRMLITCLWYFVMNFVIIAGFAFILLLAWIIPFAIHFVLPTGLIVFAYAVLYVAKVWQVGTVVSVMEEDYYGLEGMKRSRRLIHGKRTTAWALTITCMVIVGLFNYAAFLAIYSFGGLGAKILCGTAYVVLACVITLMWEVTQSVLYFVCKSHHAESVDVGFSLDGYPEKDYNNNGGLKLEP